MFYFSFILHVRAAVFFNVLKTLKQLWNAETIRFRVLFQFYFMLCEPLLQYYRILCLVHTADRDKTRLSCLVGGVTRVGDNLRQFSVVLNYIVSWTVFSSPVCSVNAFANKSCSRRISRLDKTAEYYTKHILFRNFLSPTVLRQFCSHSRHGHNCSGIARHGELEHVPPSSLRMHANSTAAFKLRLCLYFTSKLVCQSHQSPYVCYRRGLRLRY